MSLSRVETGQARANKAVKTPMLLAINLCGSTKQIKKLRTLMKGGYVALDHRADSESAAQVRPTASFRARAHAFLNRHSR